MRCPWGTTRLRRPQAAALVGTGSPIAHPRLHQVHADGSAVLLLADNEPVLQRLRGDLPVMLELTDPAPVDLREPVRGLLWITGQLSAVDPVRARRIALGLAERHPQPALLELGHGATMVRLTPGSVVLSDAEGSAALGRHLPGPLHDLREVRIRPLGVDRCGLRLRVEVGDRDHDVRLAWEHPISTADELRPQLQRLVGCPHRPS